MNFHYGTIFITISHKKLFYFIFLRRILVPSDSVGAIIGKQGTTVKQIKQKTHAK